MTPISNGGVLFAPPGHNTGFAKGGISQTEIGGAKAAKELGIPEGTIHTWLKAVRAGKLDIGEGSHTPASAMSLSEEITMLRKRVKEQDKEIRRLKEENEFLEEASAFFAASRRKSAKTRE